MSTDQTPPSNKTNLFRQKAIDEIAAKRFGNVILVQPRSHVWVTVVFALIILAILCFFIFFSTSRKVQTVGTLVPQRGMVQAYSPQSGIIAQKMFKEGEQVRSGQTLYVVKSELIDHLGKDSNQTVSRLLEQQKTSYTQEIADANQQALQRGKSLDEKLRELIQEEKRIVEQIELQEKRLQIAEQNLKRYKELNTTQFISLNQVQAQESEWLDQKQKLIELKRALINSQKEARSVNAEREDLILQTKRQINALQRDEAGVSQNLTQNQVRREFAIRAPIDGVVSMGLFEIGQPLPAGQQVASLVPENSPLEAELYAPSSAIGFIKSGMKVWVRYHAYPYQKFGQYGARVREISKTAVRPEELKKYTHLANEREPVYRIRLELEEQHVRAYGKAMALMPGMQLDASIVLESRQLYEWILEPLFSLSGKI